MVINNIEFLSSNKTWESIDNLLLIEGQSYIVKIPDNYRLKTTGLEVELDKKNPTWYKIVVPFKTGYSKIILMKDKKEYRKIEKKVYPDGRKIIYEDYIKMMSDVISFKNLSISIDDESVEKQIFHHTTKLNSYTVKESMFIFLQSCFELVIPFIKNVCENPMKEREKSSKKFPIYRTDKIDSNAINWISRNTEKCFDSSNTFPSFFKTKINYKSYETYENIAIYNIINNLISLCSNIYKKHKYLKAKKMEQQLLFYLNRSHLKTLNRVDLPFHRTKKITMNESYSKIFDFYQSMKHIAFNVNPASISLLSIPLSKTYKLYEIWTYLKLIEALKEDNKIIGTLDVPIWYNLREECFDIVHGNKSRINLLNGYHMYYQKNYVKEGADFATYTTTLIPDISIIKDEKIHIFDAKYRISENLDSALSELHKYRDGIRVTRNLNCAVVNSYIITPTISSRPEVHGESFQSKWKMGCILLKPSNTKPFSKFIMTILYQNRKSFLNAVYMNIFDTKAIYEELNLPGVILCRDL